VGATGDCLITADGELAVPTGTGATTGHSCALVIRPEHLSVAPPGGGGLAGTVVETVYAGAETRLLVALASGTVLTVRHTGAQRSPDVGDMVAVSWDRDRARLLAT
jgi:putative spermidine/putrescine transport system ATP-binding protein